MTSQEKLIRFMEGKASLITKATGKPSELYFNKKDEKYLRQLDSQLARDIWLSIKEAIREGMEGLREDLCPFCLMAEGKCHICPYAEHHEMCHHPYSHFALLINSIDYNYGSAEKVLTNEFYVNLLRSIEKEDSKCQTSQ